MSKAAEVMREEIDYAVNCCVFVSICFSCCMVMTFWMVMTVGPAVISTIVFAAVALNFYHRCNRLRRKLFYTYDPTMFSDEDKFANPEDIMCQNRTDGRNVGKVNTAEAFKSSATSKFTKFFGVKAKKDDRYAEIQPARDGAGELSNLVGNAAKERSIIMEGYITQNEDPRTGARSRSFYVLYDNGDLYQYESKRVYLDDPSNAINSRPIDVTDCDIMVGMVIMHMKLKDLSIRSKVKPWVFQFDSEEELQLWTDALGSIAGVII